MLSLSEAKKHLVVEDSHDDALIGSLVAAATDFIEGHTHQTIKERVKTLVIDGFSDEIELPAVPVQSVDSIKYNDTDEAEQTLATSVYRVDSRNLKTKVCLAYDQDWPNTTAAPESVTITYTAGYEAGLEPELLKQAALLLLGSLYDQRENHITGVSIGEVPISAEFLMQKYVVPVIG